MVIRAEENSWGAWAFLVGVILAVIIGLSTSSFLSLPNITKYSKQIYVVLILLGMLVGFFIKANVKDSQTFLIAGTIIIIVSRFGMESVTGSLIGIGLGDTVSSTFAALITLFAPATIIVALKTLFGVAKI
jgi:hypothetical protein